MKKAILLIDGENFLHKVEQVIDAEDILPDEYDLREIKLKSLIDKIFADYKDIEIIEIRYYCAKLEVYKPMEGQSYKLIRKQRKLKNTLEKQGIKFNITGHVRPQESLDDEGKIIAVSFKEKGVDVQIAVDMVSLACDKLTDTIILCSSDSDLQPAVKEVRKRGIEVIYLGFSIEPNKGLSATTNQTILFRNPEIVESIKTMALPLSVE